MTVFLTILCIILGYLLGSVPFALVIGKTFYDTDLRQHGSGNLGGTNAGRVLGKGAGIAVIVCDVLKVFLSVWLASNVSPAAAMLTGVACCFGHCYPIFASFHGGKAVAAMFGFLLATSIFVFHNFWYVLAPFVMFMIVLYLYKWVSVASICAACCSSLIITTNFWISWSGFWIILASWLITGLVIGRHYANIAKVRDNTENKITWM